MLSGPQVDRMWKGTHRRRSATVGVPRMCDPKATYIRRVPYINIFGDTTYRFLSLPPNGCWFPWFDVMKWKSVSRYLIAVTIARSVGASSLALVPVRPVHCHPKVHHSDLHTIGVYLQLRAI